MPVQLDLFGSPLRPPKKIREDEAPATAAPVEKETEIPATAESYIAVIHPKDNKQGWHTVTTTNEPEPQPLEEEEEATGVNEEAAIGEEAFEEQEPAADTDTVLTEEPFTEDELVEVEATNNELVVEEEAAIDNEEPETEGIDNFSEAETEEPVEELEEAPAIEKFSGDSTDDFTDEEPDEFIEEELVTEPIKADGAEDFTEEEEEADEENTAKEPETADETVLAEGESTTSEKEEVPVEEDATAEELATESNDDFSEEEIGDEVSADEVATEDGTIADEIETEGSENFSEEEVAETDDPTFDPDEIANDAKESVVAAEEEPEENVLLEEELILEETPGAVIEAENGIFPQTAAAVADEPLTKQRGRKPIQDYDEEAGNLNVPPDEDLFKRQYYSMRETAAMFGVNQSLLRFWENEFKILQPKKNKKGDRYFRPVDVKNLVLIHHLLRVRKFTMEGAKEYLQSNKKAGDAFELGKRLEKLKSFLLELKASL